MKTTQGNRKKAKLQHVCRHNRNHGVGNFEKPQPLGSPMGRSTLADQIAGMAKGGGHVTSKRGVGSPMGRPTIADQVGTK